MDFAPAVSGAAGAEAVATDEFQVQLDDGTCKAFIPDVSAMLIEAQTQGQPSMRFDRGGATMQVHVASVTQMNISSGKVRKMRRATRASRLGMQQ